MAMHARTEKFINTLIAVMLQMGAVIANINIECYGLSILKLMLWIELRYMLISRAVTERLLNSTHCCKRIAPICCKLQ